MTHQTTPLRTRVPSRRNRAKPSRPWRRSIKPTASCDPSGVGPSKLHARRGWTYGRESHVWLNGASDLVDMYASLRTPRFLVSPHPGAKHQVVTNKQPPRQPACRPNHITLVKRIPAGYEPKTDWGNPSPGSPRFEDYPQPAKVTNPSICESHHKAG